MKKLLQIAFLLLVMVIGSCSDADVEDLSPETTSFNMQQLPENYHVLAPDNSEIRLLTKTKNGSMVHCRLPPGQTSVAVTHQTIDELWYFINGEGEVWMKNSKSGYQEVFRVSSGTALSNPLGTHFQFRNTGDSDLDFVIVSIPPWPGDQEAFQVDGKWSNN